MSDSLNKTLLKKFAAEARNELKEKIALKASLYGITLVLSEKDKKTNGLEGFEKNESIVINLNNVKRTLSKEESSQRTALINKIQIINREDRNGFNEVIEEVAYTWFNRFVALRYMEVNGYLPNRINILASRDNSNTPEILTEAMNINLPIDKNLVYELKKDNKNEDLYRYLVELQCGELNKSLPFMFEKIGHYAELLFPAGVISSRFFRTLVDIEIITEEAWSNVEIIGWLYQYYISEEKDRVIKAKQKYKKNEIPFATQLFTPDWIVRYMVQNSLGRYWVESHEDDSDLKENWEFYLENPEKEPDFDVKIAPYINKNLEVEDIKCFDPACGSGHILVYMFDILYEIYSKCGYSRGDIPMLIIEKNIYGLDIDTRAYQLACFAVIMKGMSYDKLLLRKIEREVDNRGKYIDLNIACVKETNILFEDENTTIEENIAFLAKEESGETYDKVKAFVESLKNANTFGSLTKIEGFDKEFLENRLEEIKNDPGIDLFGSKSRENWEVILEDLIKQAIIMERKYDVLVTNPPYMGNKYMNPKLSEFMKEKYNKYKNDLFSAFMDYCFSKTKQNGNIGLMTPLVWMFIASYKELRQNIVMNKNINSLIQLEYHAFADADVQICTFVIRNYSIDLMGEYISLADFTGSKNQPIKTLEAIENRNVNYAYRINSRRFNEIDGYPIAYWASDKIREIFLKSEKLGDLAEARQGMATADNNRFLRLWSEVDFNKVGLEIKSLAEATECSRKWFPYNKGGDYKKWYGNNEYVVNWENDGFEIKNFTGGTGRVKSRVQNKEFYFKSGVTWSFINSTNFGVRYSKVGSIFDVAGSSIFPDEDKIYYIVAFLCSKITYKLLKMQNPTINFQVGNIANLPIIFSDDETKEIINKLVIDNISLAKEDWDRYETSLEFKCHDLINLNQKKLEYGYNNIFTRNIKNIEQTKINEEKINEMFIKTYNLKEEFDSYVEYDDITINRIELKSEFKNLISYFIGCLFGRYSLDKEGLIFAGGEFNVNEYRKFVPDNNNIIPVSNCESRYNKDDIIVRFEEFLKVVYSDEYLDENIDFIADALEKKNNESSRECIRRYFANEFFTEHCKIYKKRPIYWLFTSGKNKAFSCLVYQHRIDKNLLSKMRLDYVQPLQNKLEIEQKDAMDTLNSECSSLDKKEAKKKLILFEKQIDELKIFHDKLRHMADEQIEIDLDNGVIYNHGLFKDLVAKIK